MPLIEAFAGFDWDDGNRAKCQKHGVSLGEIEDIFTGPVAIRPDMNHSQAETRFLGIGRTSAGRHVLIAFTIRDKETANDIYARSARVICIVRRSSILKKPIPELTTDDQAERFVDDADLSLHDLTGFVQTRFEFQPKAAQLNMRLPRPLLDAVKASAKARGIPYTSFVRETLENAVAPAAGPAGKRSA